MEDSTRIVSPTNVIRSTEMSDREVFSDVFVFEGSVNNKFFLFRFVHGKFMKDVTEYYVVVLMTGNAMSMIDEESSQEKIIKFTVQFLTFSEISVCELPFLAVR